MNELARVLDELVADAPLEKESWSDVVARSRKLRHRPRLRKRVVLVLAAVAIVGLAGTAIGVGIDLITQQERFHARSDDPRRIGPLGEVVSGENWALLAWRGEAGICLDFAVPGNSAFGCGFPVRGAKPATDTSGAGAPTHAVAGFVCCGPGWVGGDGQTAIFGVAAREVAAVKVELRDGRVVDAPLYDAPPGLDAPVRFFLGRLLLRRTRGSGPPPLVGGGPLPKPVGSPVRAYRAYDASGRLIERVRD